MIADQGTRGVTWVTLATSASTLLCCALPALLVTLVAGAVLASAVTHLLHHFRETYSDSITYSSQ